MAHDGVGKRLRLGLVGAGAVMGQHLRGLRELDRAEVVGVASARPERAAEAAAEAGASPFASLEKLLDQAKPDAVIVGVPPYLNPAACAVLVDRRIPFLAEKPLAADDDAAVERISAAIQVAPLVTAVGYQARAVDFLPQIRALIAERPVQLAICRWLGGTPPPAWWARSTEGGGQIVEQQTHQFDLCRHLLGEATVLAAATAGDSLSRVPDADVAGVGSALLRFDSGALGSFSNANVSRRGQVEVQLIARDRTITIGWGGWPIVDYWAEIEDKAGTRRLDNQVDPWVSQMAAFLDAVESGDPARPLCPYPDAALTYRLTRQVIEAAGGRA